MSPAVQNNYIHVHHSTVYREIARNSVNGKYNPVVAETKQVTRRRKARKYNKISRQTWKLDKGIELQPCR